MAEIRIEIREDVLTPRGGHAVILLRGLDTAPADPTYRIDPIDESLAIGGEEGWPFGARKPLRVRTSDLGVELVIGPDVTEHRLLMPGTPVAILVPALGLRQEVRWPNVRPILMPAEKRLPEITPLETVTKPAAAPMLAAASDEPRQQAKSGQPVQNERQPQGSRLELAPDSPETGTKQKAETAEAAKKTPVPLTAEVERETPAPAWLAPTRSSPEKDVKPPVAARTPIATPAMQPRSPKEGSTAIATPAAKSAPKRTAEAAPAAPRAAAPAPVAAPSPQRPAGSRLAAFALGILVGGALVAACFMSLDMPPRLISATTPAPETAAPPVVVAAPAPAPQPVPRSQPEPRPERAAVPNELATIAGVFTKDAVSPLGKSASDVDVDAALRLADQYRRGATVERHSAESAFWARHAVTRSLDSDRMRWALTQAGAGLAQDARSQLDYAKARLVWEIAADLGDPVALCLLSELYEHGMGVRPDKVAALRLLLKAKAVGGCRDIDVKIERLQP